MYKMGHQRGIKKQQQNLLCTPFAFISSHFKMNLSHMMGITIMLMDHHWLMGGRTVGANVIRPEPTVMSYTDHMREYQAAMNEHKQLNELYKRALVAYMRQVQPGPGPLPPIQP
jgi:hypothetical protein